MDTPSSLSTETMSRLSSRLLFFGNDFPSDNLGDLFRRLHRWSKDKRFTVLGLFLEDAVAVIKSEIGQLSQPVPEQVSSIQSIMGLVDAYEAIRITPIGASLESALLCTLQIAVLIGWVFIFKFIVHCRRTDHEPGHTRQQTRDTISAKRGPP